jgi:hypothetical protein
MTKTAAKLSKKTVKKTEILANLPENSSENKEFSPFLYSISALAKKFKLDRATVVSRLDDAEIEPHSKRSNEKLYHLDDVEVILLQKEIDVAKLRKLDIEAQIKEHDLQVKKGEFASVGEFTEVTQRIFGRLYKKIVVQLPPKLAKRLHNANSEAEVSAVLKAELAKEFDSLRSDFTKYLK